MKYKGCNGQVKTGVALDSIVELIGFTVDETAEALDASVIGGDCAKRVVKGQTGWSGSIDAYYDPAEIGTNNLAVGSDVLLTLYPAGDTPGLQELAGQALITSVGTPVEIEGMIQQSFAYEGNGALSKTTVV